MLKKTSKEKIESLRMALVREREQTAQKLNSALTQFEDMQLWARAESKRRTDNAAYFNATAYAYQLAANTLRRQLNLVVDESEAA